MQSFADLQCKMTNVRAYRNRHWTWSSFQTPFKESTCGLICINEKGIVALRSPIMIDGTPCNPGTRDVCIEGTCRKVGCDWVIDSRAKEDACGVCHGGGTGCRIVHGQFLEPQISGLLPFLKLPVGTSMIYIREINPSTCSLCITNSVNSTYFLRGNQELPGNVFIAGSNGVYDRKADLERIFLKDPLKMPITVNVLCTSEENSGIIFQYALPERNTNYIPNYQWQFLSWDKCSDVCGGGTQVSKAVCVEDKAGEVEDRYCLESKRPPDIVRPCNNFPCETKWWVGPWSDCASENSQGYQERIVLCMKSKDINGIRAVVVHDSECRGQQRPIIERSCNAVKEPEKMESLLLGDRWKRSYIEFMRPYNPEEESDYDEDSKEIGLDEGVLDAKIFLDDFEGDLEGGVIENLISDDDASNVSEEEEFEGSTSEPSSEDTARRSQLYRQLLKAKQKRGKLKRFNSSRSIVPKARRKQLHKSCQNKMSKKINEASVTENPTDGEEEFDATTEFSMEEISRSSTEIYLEALSETTTEICPSPEIIQTVTEILSTTRFANTSLKSLPIVCLTEPSHVTEMPQVKSTMYVTTTTDSTGTMFFHMWNTYPREVYKPTEHPPQVDIADPSCFQLFIAPILPVQGMFSASDAAYQMLGSIAVIPIGTETKVIDVAGSTVLKAIAEVGRQATKPPLIELCENE